MSLSKRQLAIGIALVGVATLVVNVSSYALSVIAARNMTPENFGGFSALLSVSIIGATTAAAVQLVSARRIALKGLDDTLELYALRTNTFIISGLIALLGFVVFWPMSVVLHIDPLATLAIMLSISLTAIGSYPLGVLQGSSTNHKFGYAYGIVGLTRAAGSAIAIYLNASILSATFGLLIGTAIGSTIALMFVPKLNRVREQNLNRRVRNEIALATFAILGLYLMTNIDVILARIFLTASDSGEYSAGALVAKIAFFLPYAISLVLFPNMAKSTSKKAVLLTATLTTAISGIFVIFSWLYGEFLMFVLGGSQYSELSSYVYLFALEGTLFALAQVLLFSRLSQKDSRANFTIWTTCGVLILWILIFSHNSVVAILLSTLVAAMILVFSGTLLELKNPREISEKP